MKIMLENYRFVEASFHNSNSNNDDFEIDLEVLSNDSSMEIEPENSSQERGSGLDNRNDDSLGSDRENSQESSHSSSFEEEQQNQPNFRYQKINRLNFEQCEEFYPAQYHEFKQPSGMVNLDTIDA